MLTLCQPLRWIKKIITAKFNKTTKDSNDQFEQTWESFAPDSVVIFSRGEKRFSNDILLKKWAPVIEKRFASEAKKMPPPKKGSLTLCQLENADIENIKKPLSPSLLAKHYVFSDSASAFHLIPFIRFYSPRSKIHYINTVPPSDNLTLHINKCVDYSHNSIMDFLSQTQITEI